MGVYKQAEDDSTRRVGWPMMVGLGLCLSALLMVVWRSSLDGDFLFDDYGDIVENQKIRALWPLDSFQKSGRPLGLYTFALNYHFAQLNPRFYHLTNLLIHVANSLLLYLGIILSRKLWSLHLTRPVELKEQRRWLLIAAISALLWGIHPITTQAVTYTVQRYESLATLGYLGAWVGMLLVILSQRWGLLVLFLSAWVGLLSKQIFATAPLAIVLFDRLISRATFREILKQRWLAYALLLTPYVWFIPNVSRWFDPSKSSSMGFGLKTVSSWEYLRTQPEVLIHYLRLTFWPEPLCFDYAWRVQQNSFIYFSLGALILSVLGIGAWLYFQGTKQQGLSIRRASLGLSGWMILTFFFILAPTSSFVPIADLCFEHRMYLSSAIIVVGMTLLAGNILETLEARSDRPALLRLGFSFALMGVALFWGWKTDLRNRDYQNGITMWKSVLAVRPNNPRAWYMLGKQHYDRKQYFQALPYLKQAVSFPRTLGEFHLGLADCLSALDEPDAAIAEYQRALTLKPTLSNAHNGLGVIQHRRGELAAAKRLYRTAIDLGSSEANYNLAIVLIDLHEYAEAITLLESTIQEHPRFTVSIRRLAWVLATAPDEKLRDGKRAKELMSQSHSLIDNASPHVWDTHAAVLAELGDFDGAVQAASQALKLSQLRNDTLLEEDIVERLKAYRQKRPWREGGAS